MLRLTMAAIAAVLLIRTSATATDLRLTSPNSHVKIDISISKDHAPTWSLTYKGASIFRDATAGFHDNTPVSVLSVSKRSISRPLPLLFGENDVYQENYNQLTIRLTANRSLVFRAYDDGAAFRYIYSDSVGFDTEYTTFPLGQGSDTLWQQDISHMPQDQWAKTNGPEEPYQKVSFASMKGTTEFPLLIQSGKWTALINEAANSGYPRGILVKKDGALRVHLPSPGIARTTPSGAGSPRSDHSLTSSRAIGRSESPWRYVLLAPSPLRLIERSGMIYSLAPPSAIKNTAWIKPGKMMRAITLETDSIRKTIDFCHDMNFPYTLLDAGWYGLGYGMSKEFRPESDALKQISTVDIPALVQYGKTRGVGIILYVNEVALRLQLDKIIPLYKSWGVAGLKFGFVYSRLADGQRFIMEAVRRCAEAGLIVDVHDDYRPTGMSRTWPNLLTQEGVRGAEHETDADHNTILPFARLTTGAADYTIIYKGGRYRDSTLLTEAEKRGKIYNLASTSAHQLAMSVIIFSPMQCLFWYGKAADYDVKSTEVEFFKHVPVTWQETRALYGEPGEYITMARRNGNAWFLGSITNKTARSWKVALNFLPAGKKYTASIFEDDGMGGIRKTTRQVTREDIIDVILAGSSGQAVMLD